VGDVDASQTRQAEEKDSSERLMHMPPAISRIASKDELEEQDTQTPDDNSYVLDLEDMVESSSEALEDLRPPPTLSACVGNGGWPGHTFPMTPAMEETKMEAITLYKKATGRDLSPELNEWLSPNVLRNFTKDVDKQRNEDVGKGSSKLSKALQARSKRDRIINEGGFRLNGSLRVIGMHDEGGPVLMMESITMRSSFSNYLNHLGAVVSNAIDMSRPGVNARFVMIADMRKYRTTYLLNPAPLLEVFDSLNGEHRERLRYCFILGLTPMLESILRAGMSLLREETRQKIVGIRAEDVEDRIGSICDKDTTKRILSALRNRALHNRFDADSEHDWHPFIDMPFFREKLNQPATLQRMDAELYQKYRAAIQEWRVNMYWEAQECRM